MASINIHRVSAITPCIFLVYTLSGAIGCSSSQKGSDPDKCDPKDPACKREDGGGGSGGDASGGSADGQGCQSDSACASGACNKKNECAQCIEDSECQEGRVCGTFACGGSCGGKDDAACGAGTTCCSSACVDTVRDIEHCGACGKACSARQFCGTIDGAPGCTAVSLKNLCKNANITLILNRDFSSDIKLATSLEPTLKASCATNVRTAYQHRTSALNPKTGQPVSGGNDLLVAVGSIYTQKVVEYVEGQGIAPVTANFEQGEPNAFVFRTSKDGKEILRAPIDGEDEQNGHFIIQMVRDPASGSVVLAAYGYLAQGSAAATWYLANKILPEASKYDKAWYIYQWKSTNAEPDAADTFTLLKSGS